MKKKWRILTLCMVLVMLCGMLPLAASAAQPDTIALEDIKNVNITASGEYVDFYFTPTQTGYYGFESFDSLGDPLAYIYDGSEELDRSDDEGESNNFLASAELTAGVQYTLRARCYSNSTGSMKVTLYKMVEPTEMEAFEEKTNLQINVGAGFSFEPEFYPEKSYEVDVTYSSSNTDVVDTNGWNYYAMAPGTATLTATSENGLRDSVKITVVPTTSIKVGDTFKISMTNRTLPTYAFKAPADGNYVFYMKADMQFGAPVDFIVYDPENGDDVGGSWYTADAKICYMELQKNDLVYMVMQGYFGPGMIEVGLLEGVTTGGIKPRVNEYVGYAHTEIYPDIEPSKINALVDYRNITYTSSDETVVEVADDELRLLKKGTATITAENPQGMKCTFTVRVVDIPEITGPGPHKFSPTAAQDTFLFNFTPETSGVYYIEVENAAYCGAWINMPSADGYGYGLTAGQTYTIEASGAEGGNYSFTISTEGPNYAPPCAPGQHEWKKDGILAPTTITPGEIYVVCTKCGETDWTIADKLPVQKDVTKQFTDIKKKDWYYDEVNFAFNSKLFAGTSDTKFSPNESMTRGMFVTVLGRLGGVDVDHKVATKFKDVKKGKYYTGYVAWANEVGIVNGISATTFEPNANITREQICVMMEKFIQYIGLGLRNDTPAVKFKDASKISKWAKSAVAACQQGGIINGVKSGDGYVFNPKGNATRAEVATIIYNFVRNYPYMSYYEYIDSQIMM